MSTSDTDTPALRDVVRSAFAQFGDAAVSAIGMSTWLHPSSGGTVGPTVYSGTAGIAWALAEYAHSFSDGRAADLAKMAIAFALAHAHDIPQVQRFGFYGGWSGIAFATAHVGELLGDRSLEVQGESLLSRLSSEPLSGEFDLISGLAGAILAGSLLESVFGKRALDLAYSAALRLRETAHLEVRDGIEVACWSPGRRTLPLTGLAHGASGIGWALCELWAHRQRNSWLRELAEKAFCYEDSMFNPDEHNWPDLRHYPSFRATLLLPPSYQVAWCHGAGGIALSRLRAYELTGSSNWSRMARVGAGTLGQGLAEQVEAGNGDLGLCHGLAGNAEMLGIVGDRLGIPSFAPMITRVTRTLNDELDALARNAGLVDADPGLLLGITGIAGMLLRHFDKRTMTPLLPTHIPNKT